MFGEGISREGGLLDVGVAMSIVAKTGAWFTFGETRLGQGREAAKEFLKANPDVSAEIEKQIRGKMSEVSLPVEGSKRPNSRPWPARPAASGSRRGERDWNATPPDRPVDGPRGGCPVPRNAAALDRGGQAPSHGRRLSGGAGRGAIGRLTDGHARRSSVAQAWLSRAIGLDLAAPALFDGNSLSRASTARSSQPSW